MACTTRILVFVTLMLASTVVLGKLHDISECGSNLLSVLEACSQFIRKDGPKVSPSDKCCEVLKKVDIPCLCKNFPPEIEGKISMEKAVYVAQTCGCSVPKGTKCGSYTVPPAAHL
ncbi:uncharacterized protein LOC113874576 [Abrus precatorius]|uniref:Uncharacterized protein LOC113874576 n=1 Tax=Abrus precatorius TaxID=3816 RepID=A0A8B8MJ34_ABRPR|nr:uncharacterized protein LOC113874576 [Abrus precatorius]